MTVHALAFRNAKRRRRSSVLKWAMFCCAHVWTTKSVGTLVIFFVFSGMLVLTAHLHFRSHLVAGPQPKVILSWTPYFDDAKYLPRSFDGLGCLIDNCVTTSNRSRVNVSDAIIFHWRDIKDIPYKINQKHKWILYNYESPPHVDWRRLKPVIGNMTWVATYRSDSDLVTPYGVYRRKSSEDKPENDIGVTLDVFERKKSVVWLVSNCHTPGRREKFVEILQSHIDVKIFGLCGDLAPCEKNKSRIFCLEKMAKHYKFYLSFENSLCKDYATEKVFLPLTAGMVPVVFGGANYNRILPPNSFIDALAFQTPKDLADYLLKVGRNFTLYQSYQKWRERYEIEYNEAPNFYWLCELCRLLNEEEQPASVVPLDQNLFYDWWFTGAECTSWKSPTNYTNFTEEFSVPYSV